MLEGKPLPTIWDEGPLGTNRTGDIAVGPAQSPGAHGRTSGRCWKALSFGCAAVASGTTCPGSSIAPSIGTSIPRHLESQLSSTTHRRAGKVFSPRRSSFSSPMRRICGQYRKAANGPVAGGIVIPFGPGTGFGCLPGLLPLRLALQGRRLKSFSMSAGRWLGARPPPRSGGRQSCVQPRCSSCSQLWRPRSVGLRPMAPPQPRLYDHGSNPPTAIPSPRPRPTPGQRHIFDQGHVAQMPSSTVPPIQRIG